MCLMMRYFGRCLCAAADKPQARTVREEWPVKLQQPTEQVMHRRRKTVNRRIINDV